MDFQLATEWVTQHEPIIKGFIAKYRNFSPYEEGDFMQEAFEAALRATQRSRNNGIAFEAAFWVIFKSQVRVIMPHPGSNSHGSNSVPSHLCSGDLALIANHQEPHHEQPDIDALYHAVCPVLTEKERQVLFLALGLGCEGRLSNKEIAQSLGCVESNIRDIVNRAMNRIRSQVRSGSVTPPDSHEG